MNKKPYSQVFDVVAHDLVPDSVDLAPRIITHIQKGKGAFVQPKLKLLASALAVVTVFIVLLANGPAVVHALQNLFGYIPGLGTVESDGSLRTLAEPVSLTKDGVTVTIEKGSTDTKNTILATTVTGLTSTQINDCFLSESGGPQLRLSDGKKLKMSNWSGIEDDLRYYFPPLPAGSNDVTLELPCLLYKPSPADWEFPLHFIPATGTGLLPVDELQDANAVAQSTVEPPFGAPYQVSMALEKVVTLEDGYILMGSINWTYASLAFVDVGVPQIIDANGKRLSFVYISPDRPDVEQNMREPWAYQISGKQHAWPLTLKMDTILVTELVRSAQPSTFVFDPGPNPQILQIWPLDQDVVVNGFTIHSDLAYLIPSSREDGGQQLFLDIKPDSEDVVGLSLVDMRSDGGFSDAGTGSSKQQGKFVTGLIYPNGMPSSPRLLTFQDITYYLHGDWQVTWQP